MLKIHLDEEYGYREWVWFFPGTKEEALIEWKAGRRPLCFWGKSAASETIKGTVAQIFFKHETGNKAFIPLLFSLENNEDGDPVNSPVDSEGNPLGIAIEGVPDMSFFDGFGHVHEKDDTFLQIGEEIIRDTPQDVPETDSNG